MWHDHLLSPRYMARERAVGVGGWRWQGRGRDCGQNFKRGEGHRQYSRGSS